MAKLGGGLLGRVRAFTTATPTPAAPTLTGEGSPDKETSPNQEEGSPKKEDSPEKSDKE